MTYNRRNFMKTAGAGFLGGTLQGCFPDMGKEYTLTPGENVSVSGGGFRYDIRLDGVYQVMGGNAADLTVNGDTYTLTDPTGGDFRRTLSGGELIPFDRKLDADFIDLLEIHGTKTQGTGDDSILFRHVPGDQDC